MRFCFFLDALLGREPFLGEGAGEDVEDDFFLREDFFAIRA